MRRTVALNSVQVKQKDEGLTVPDQPALAQDNDDADPSNEDSKQFSLRARNCIRGEAFFELLMTQYAIPHHISGQKDIGTDFICEWVHGNNPSGILFGAQVRAFTIASSTGPRHLGTETRLNGLEKYSISASHLEIDPRTLRYWKGLGLPAYLFAVVHTPASDREEDRLDCYYKRFTTVLTLGEHQEKQCYYKVSRGTKLLAFADDVKKRKGFARDLYIDLMRWAYYNGNIAYLSPLRLGLQQFGEEERVFRDLFNDYKAQVRETFTKTRRFLEQLAPDLLAPIPPPAEGNVR